MIRILERIGLPNRKRILCNNMSSLSACIEPRLQEIKAAGTWKTENLLVSPQRPNITLAGGKKLLNFCANNYLGLADNPDVIEAAKVALDKYGSGLSSARSICGTLDIHEELEEKLTKFHGKEAAILYIACFDANVGLFEALLTADDAILSDELNHASIIDGVRLCKAKRFRYKHRDMKDLEEKLKESMSCRIRLIATDGVFSMDGTIAPLPEIIKLAKKYDAFTFADDCHATGIFGKTGRGTEEYFDRIGDIDILNSTLGKALGGASGGYTVAKKELIDLLKQTSRPYLFSNSMPPAVTGAAIKALDLITDSTQFLDKLHENTKRFRTEMTNAGFTVDGDNHPICPIMLGDARLASTFAKKLNDKGIYVVSFSYPMVPKGKARIRVQINAGHTKEDIDRAINAFTEIGRELKVVS